MLWVLKRCQVDLRKEKFFRNKAHWDTVFMYHTFYLFLNWQLSKKGKILLGSKSSQTQVNQPLLKAIKELLFLNVKKEFFCCADGTNFQSFWCEESLWQAAKGKNCKEKNSLESLKMTKKWEKITKLTGNCQTETRWNTK